MRTASRGRRAFAALLTGAVIVSGGLFGSSAASAVPTTSPPPTVMAALGDSITQAAMTCSSLTSCPSNSWATGTNTTVVSHASRFAVRPVAYNYAVSGAKSSALNGQALKAVAVGAKYVTIEIGANDACTRTVSGMTTTAAYRASIQTALATLAASPAQPEIFVASIPNLMRMYELNKSSGTARLVWAVLQTCQSLLASPTSTKATDVQRRAAVQQRVNEYNAALAEVCAATPKCRYDGGTVANYQFAKGDISTRDYFHPSLTGQKSLATITWTASQWAS